jgi:hypothetical protein
MQQRAFSAVELIGVLAIIAILTALLLPRISHHVTKEEVVQTAGLAHLTETVVAIQTIEGVINAHLAQFGSLGSFNGAPPTVSGSYDNFSQVLLREGLMERPFGVTLGTNSFLRLLNASGLTATTPVDGRNGAYDLHGDGRNNVVGAAFVVEAIIAGVTEQEARAINDRLDGPRLSAPAGSDDWLGRAIYRQMGADGRTELHIHILHK